MPPSCRAALLGCALIVLLTFPAGRADASTAGSEPDAVVGNALAVLAAPGEANDVTVSYDYVTTLYTVTDGAGATAESGCDQVDATTVNCPAHAGGENVNRILVDLGDGDDAFTMGETSVFYGATVEGGAGADTLAGGNRPDLLAGGAGDDVISGGGEADLLLGDDGDDTLGGDDGDDELDGGEGVDATDAGAGEDLVNLREQPDGRSGTADPAATCGTGGDRVALDVADAAPAADCERQAPRFAGAPVLVAPAASVGRTVSLSLAAAGVTGAPAPELFIIWLSCTLDVCEEVDYDVEQYTLQASDAGRYVGAVVIASNGSSELGSYAEAFELTDLAGPVTAPPPIPGAPLVPQTPAFPAPPGVVKPPAPPTAAQLHAMRVAQATRVMGAPVTSVRDAGGVALYRRAGTRSVILPRARRTKVLAAVCRAASCRVSVRSELRLKIRRGGRTQTRRIRLTSVRRNLKAGDAITFDVRLTAVQRSAVHRAKSATLRMSYEIGAATRGAVTFPVRLR